MNFLPLLEPVTVEDYPYGFNLRTSITYQIEHKPKQGYRLITTTINPKTGRPNQPKKSTYHSFARLYREPETNHIKLYAFTPYDIETYEKALAVGLFTDIPKEVYDHDKIMSYTLFTSIKFITSFTGFSINGRPPVNPITPPTPTPDELEALKLCQYEATKKVYLALKSREESR